MVNPDFSKFKKVVIYDKNNPRPKRDPEEMERERIRILNEDGAINSRWERKRLRVNVTLSPDEIAIAKKIGRGKASTGIGVALVYWQARHEHIRTIKRRNRNAAT